MARWQGEMVRVRLNASPRSALEIETSNIGCSLAVEMGIMMLPLDDPKRWLRYEAMDNRRLLVTALVGRGHSQRGAFAGS